MTTLDEAMRWYDRGISPIPLIYRSKRPVVKWRQWENTLPPLVLVKRWFAGLRNIAIVLSGSLVVLDFDMPGAYLRWQAKHPAIAQTLTTKSRRGYHVYLRIDTQTQTAAMDGGEILAAGHMVTVPPSVHQSGYRYQSVGATSILHCSSLCEIGIEPVEREAVSILSDVGDYCAPVWLPTGVDAYEAGGMIERIKSRVSTFDLLQRLGVSVPTGQQSIVMRCPFHEDRNPSFQVWSDGAYCHSTSCRAHRAMDVIDLAALWWGVGNKTAIGMLSQMA